MFVTKAEKISCELLNQAASQNAASLVDLAESAYQGHLAQLCKDIILQQQACGFCNRSLQFREKLQLRRN